MKNIISVKIGNIRSNHLHQSMEYLLGNEKVKSFKIIIGYLFILVFGLVGVLFTILFHKRYFKRCFHFFIEHIKSDFIIPHTYTTIGNDIFSRVLSVIIPIFMLSSTFIIIVGNIIENLNEDVDYDWAGLHKSLKDNGYVPNIYKNGYITVSKLGGEYVCSDGNHRHRVLLDIYGPDKIIDVIYSM